METNAMGSTVEVGGNHVLTDIPADYSPVSRWFVLPDGPDAGKKMFFWDKLYGSGEVTNTLVFVHGNPETSYAYRKIIRTTIDKAQKPFRIVAMDHIGFGLSDQASFEMTSMDHARNLQFLVRYLDLKNVTLTIHDWGGPIGIGAFIEDPSRVAGLVITNSTVFPIPEKGLTYNNFPFRFFPWSKTPDSVPDKFWGNFSAFSVLGTNNPLKTIKNMVKEKKARLVFKQQFNSIKNVHSSKRMVRQSAVWGHGNKYVEPVMGEHDTTSFYTFIQENIAKQWGPQGMNIGVRAIIGRYDPLGKDEAIGQWLANLPQLKNNIVYFKKNGHFIIEEQPERIAEEIISLAGL